MNNYLNAEITQFQQKMNGYLMLFNYRMMNLCVKAEPAALMPATIVLEDGSYNIEDVATVEKPDDYTFKVTPKNQNNMQAVVEGILDIHPEFKMEEQHEKNEFNEEVYSVMYTMPEVDKNRRDLLNETTKTFHKECIARLDAEYAAQTASFVNLLASAPDKEADEAKDAVKDIYDEAKDQADDLLKAKMTEIEDAYQRYVEEEAQRKQKDNSGVYSMSMKWNQEE